MIQSLATTGSGNYNPVVEEYQRTWNDTRATIERVDPALWRKLTEDGKYGPNTAWTLGQLVKVPPPTRAYQMPPWYSANQSMVDAMGYSPAPTTPASAPSPGYEPTPIPVPVDSAKNVVPGIPAPVAPPPPMPTPPMPEPAAVVPSAPIPSGERELTAPGSPIVVVGKSATTLMEDDPSPPPASQELPALPVYGKVPKGDAPIIAVVAGAVALAGVTGYLIWRRRRAA